MISQQVLGETTKETYMVTPEKNKRVNAGSTKTGQMTHALRG